MPAPPLSIFRLPPCLTSKMSLEKVKKSMDIGTKLCYFPRYYRHLCLLHKVQTCPLLLLCACSLSVRVSDFGAWRCCCLLPDSSRVCSQYITAPQSAKSSAFAQAAESRGLGSYIWMIFYLILIHPANQNFVFCITSS